MSLRQGNLFWSMQFRTCKNFWDFADSKSSLNPKNSYKYKSHTAITSIVIRIANQLRIKRESTTFSHCEANRRFAKAIKKNKCASAQPNLARFVVQKIGIKGAVVPPADFLLESDKRGTPPKSEKAAAFWRVGGAGRGVQPFLRKETGESNIDCHNLAQNFRHTERSEVSKSSEYNQIQSIMTQERMGKSHRFAQSNKILNDSKVAKMDSSLTAFAQNDNMMDCFGDEMHRNDESILGYHKFAFANSHNDSAMAFLHAPKLP